MNIEIKITGGGTKAEIIQSLSTILHTIINMTDQELDRKQVIEDSTLCAEIVKDE